eukprot:1894648-Alexandrium_andersonii.AAC.1
MSDTPPWWQLTSRSEGRSSAPIASSHPEDPRVSWDIFQSPTMIKRHTNHADQLMDLRELGQVGP